MRRFLIPTAFVALCFALPFVPAVGAPKRTPAQARILEPKDFDRLDGHGPSRMKVDVIEWEGNLEIHVYPKGSLKSLGMKIDRESKTTNNAVMVIEYGFKGVPYTLIRRAVLGINLPDSFRAFRDESADDYDKIIVSGHSIADVKSYALAPPPTQLYPDYSPELGGSSDDTSTAQTNPSAKPYEDLSNGSGTTRSRQRTPSDTNEGSGIKNFAF